MKLLSLLTLLLIQPLLAGPATDALGAFREAAQAKNFDATWKHVAKFDGIPDKMTEYLKEDVKKFIELMGSGWDFQMLDEKIDGDCAVVVLNESKKEGKKAFDIDPAYLIRQDGEWRVFPDVSNYKMAGQFAKDKVETYKKLEEWFEERKAELKKKHASELKE